MNGLHYFESRVEAIHINLVLKTKILVGKSLKIVNITIELEFVRRVGTQ